jgi:membrane fusion protein (multidrug efflux system)
MRCTRTQSLDPHEWSASLRFFAFTLPQYFLKMRKFLLFFGLGSTLLAGCAHHNEHHELVSTYLVTHPVVVDTTHTHDYVCQIHSIQHIEVRALEKGYLQEVHVDEGQMVKKGQLLFRIMPLLYQAEYQKAKAEADFAEIEYKNTKALADSDVVSANELALTKAKYDKALAELSLANVHLGFTEIKAPFDGIVGRFHVRLGSLIEEGELLTSLSDNSEMWVYFNVPEAEYLDYMNNDKADRGVQVRLKMANGTLFDERGTITAIESDFDNTTGNIAFRATFPNPNGLLRHGETGNILMYWKLEDVLVIPQRATFEVLDKRYVFVIDEQGVAHSTAIRVGEEFEHLFVVTHGLTINDKILLDGIRKVRDQETISFKLANPDSVITHLGMYAE